MVLNVSLKVILPKTPVKCTLIIFLIFPALIFNIYVFSLINKNEVISDITTYDTGPNLVFFLILMETCCIIVILQFVCLVFLHTESDHRLSPYNKVIVVLGKSTTDFSELGKRFRAVEKPRGHD